MIDVKNTNMGEICYNTAMNVRYLFLRNIFLKLLNYIVFLFRISIVSLWLVVVRDQTSDSVSQSIRSRLTSQKENIILSVLLESRNREWNLREFSGKNFSRILSWKMQSWECDQVEITYSLVARARELLNDLPEEVHSPFFYLIFSSMKFPARIFGEISKKSEIYNESGINFYIGGTFGRDVLQVGRRL